MALMTDTVLSARLIPSAVVIFRPFSREETEKLDQELQDDKGEGP